MWITSIGEIWSGKLFELLGPSIFKLRTYEERQIKWNRLFPHKEEQCKSINQWKRIFSEYTKKEYLFELAWFFNEHEGFHKRWSSMDDYDGGSKLTVQWTTWEKGEYGWIRHASRQGIGQFVIRIVLLKKVEDVAVVWPCDPVCMFIETCLLVRRRVRNYELGIWVYAKLKIKKENGSSYNNRYWGNTRRRTAARNYNYTTKTQNHIFLDVYFIYQGGTQEFF